MRWLEEPPLAPSGYMEWSVTCELKSRKPRGDSIELEVYNGHILVSDCGAFMYGSLLGLPCASLNTQVGPAYYAVTCVNGIII